VTIQPEYDRIFIILRLAESLEMAVYVCTYVYTCVCMNECIQVGVTYCRPGPIPSMVARYKHTSVCVSVSVCQRSQGIQCLCKVRTRVCVCVCVCLSVCQRSQGTQSLCVSHERRYRSRLVTILVSITMSYLYSIIKVHIIYYDAKVVEEFVTI